MRRRVLLLLAAIVVFTAGGAVAAAYIKDAAAKAVAGQKPVTVLVAVRAIPAGTTAGAAAGDGALLPEQYPAADVPQGALGSVSPASRDLVISHALQPGTLLIRASLVTRVRADSGLAVPRGMVTMTIQVCLAQAVAGFIRPGAQVAVYGTTGTGGSAASCTSPGRFTKATTKLMLPRVLVLATAPAGPATPGGTQQQGTVLLTLAVTPAGAAALISLTETGSPYLTLLAPRPGISATSQAGR